MWISTQTDLIRTILSPALRLWLRSLLEQVEQLDINIQGHDRQIIKGYIPRVCLNSRRAIYQGLQLGEVLILGENIRVNIGQILRGKPLQLLEPIRVSGEVSIEEEDLNASLSSFMLSNAFTDLLIMLLELNGVDNPKQQLETYQIQWQDVALHDNQFAISGMLTDKLGQTSSVNILADLELINPQTLGINPVRIDILPHLSPLNLKAFEVDLGSDVELAKLSLVTGKLACKGNLVVRN